MQSVHISLYWFGGGDLLQTKDQAMIHWPYNEPVNPTTKGSPPSPQLYKHSSNTTAKTGKKEEEIRNHQNLLPLILNTLKILSFILLVF